MESGGQDAAESSPTALVVADGVGGYAKFGIDSADFAKELTRMARDMHQIDPKVNSKNLLDFACEEAKKFEGGATAALVKLKDGMKMESAVLGDAGYMIWEVAEADKLVLKYKSPSYQKAFNMPYQCGTLQKDSVPVIKQLEHEVKDGDIVMVYSDGLDDNLYEDDMRLCLEP